MINCVTCKTAHFFGNALASQYELRYNSFVDRQKWDLSEWQRMEYDVYDTPATTYLVWQDEHQIVRGVSRLLPTDRPYMLKDLWPDSVQTIDLPNSIKIWEGSRFCVDNTLNKTLRRRIVQEIVCSYLEYGLSNNIEKIIGIMPPSIWRSVFVRNGWEVEFIGSKEGYGGGRENIAGQLYVTPEALFSVRKQTNINHPILTKTPFNFIQEHEERVA